MNDRYLWVRNWETFQHYKKRNPPWIKTHLELLHDDTYLGLTLHQRGVLHGLWLGFAAARRRIPDSTTAASRRLGQRVTRETLDALIRAGFIEVIASAELARRTQDAMPEAEAEAEINPLTPSDEGDGSDDNAGQTNSRANGTNPREATKRKKLQAGLEDLVRRTIDEYPEPAMLEELESHGLTRDEALELVERIRGEREHSTAEVAA